MEAEGRALPAPARALERVGRAAVRGLDELGFAAALLAESLYWIALGHRRDQPVRPAPVFQQMVEIGIAALPIVSVLAATIGVMLSIQGIHTLRDFGAESQIVLGVAISVTREFAPLIVGILVAGRSGSALAARLASMHVNQEVDALRVMGINPVRFLVVPPLLAMLVVVPALTFVAGVIAVLASGLYVGAVLGMSLDAYVDQSLAVVEVGDVVHGLSKSVLFALLITLVGVVNGAGVEGGAEGVGRVTTRSVVHAISAIVLADMVFALVLAT